MNANPNITSEEAENSLHFNLVSGKWQIWEISLFLSLIIPLILFVIFSNIFVIYVIKTHPALKCPSYIYLISLACTDLVMGMFVMPVAAFYTIENVWYFGSLGCQVWTFTSFSMVCSSCHHLCLIAIDRYRAIVDYHSYSAIRSRERVLLNVICVWVLSILLIASPPFLFDMGMEWPNSYDDGIPCTIPQSPFYAMYATLVSFYVPTTLLVFVYIKLYLIGKQKFRTLIHKTNLTSTILTSSIKCQKDSSIYRINDAIRQSSTVDLSSDQKHLVTLPIPGSKRRKQLIAYNKSIWHSGKSQPLTRNTRIQNRQLCQQCQGIQQEPGAQDFFVCECCSSPNNLLVVAQEARVKILIQKERKFMFVTSLIVCTYVFCWFPGFTSYLILAVCPWLYHPPIVIILVWWLCYSNSACNPIIYTVFNKDFRSAFSNLVGLKKKN